jgi:cytochrome c oxidase subunit 2
VPELHIDTKIPPGKPTRVRVVPDKPGTFAFHCSVFCGSGHEDMSGQIVVSP